MFVVPNYDAIVGATFLNRTQAIMSYLLSQSGVLLFVRRMLKYIKLWPTVKNIWYTAMVLIILFTFAADTDKNEW